MLTLIIAVSGVGVVSAQQKTGAKTASQPLTDRQMKINADIAEIDSRHNQRLEQMRRDANAGGADFTAQDIELLAQEVAKERVDEINAYLKSEGLVACGRYEGDSLVIGEEHTSSDVEPFSLASGLTVYQQAVKDLDGSIYYYAYWDWTPTDGAYDTVWGTYDLVSAQLESDDGWRWRSLECQTWDQWGNETGFTDGNSWNTRGDGVSLRDDFWNGKIFNLCDLCEPISNTYKTDMVRISGWVTPGSTPTNRVKSNFEHNWGNTATGLSASIASTSFDNFTLSVTYNNGNNGVPFSGVTRWFLFLVATTLFLLLLFKTKSSS